MISYYRHIQAMVILLCGLLLGFAIPPLAAQSDKSPLAQDGPYQVGVRIMHLTDASRDNRALETYVWYPALVSKDAKRPYAPDASGAPYTLVIFSHGFGNSPAEGANMFINHLVSQGFVVAAVDHHDLTDLWPWTHMEALIDRPLDVLFLLNQLADLKDTPLAGLMDTENVGVVGYSLGGYTAIAVSGSRIDPRHFADACSAASKDQGIDSCSLPSDWDKLQTYHKQVAPSSSDDLWAAMTDKRIHAIIALEPCFGQLFSERGLAANTIATLVFGGTSDDICPYDPNPAYIYAHLGSLDRYLITLNKRDHSWGDQETNLMHEYISAFFGLYLQGKTDYAQYLTPDSAKAFNAITLEAHLGGK